VFRHFVVVVVGLRIEGEKRRIGERERRRCGGW
jgi:hypothetical protein